MATTKPLQLEARQADERGQGSYRRTSLERDRVRDFYAVPESIDGNENAWDALERRERMAEACYEI